MIKIGKFALAIGMCAALVPGSIQLAKAVDKCQPHVYDGAWHSRIYFPSGPESFADEVLFYKLGRQKPEDLWRYTEAATGPPDFRHHESERVARKSTFLCLGGGGSAIFRFADNALFDGPGPDLYIFEPINNSSPISVEISRDGMNWISLGDDLTTAKEIDIDGKGEKNAIYNFVKVTDKTAVDPADVWPGADIDAVGAINSASKISYNDVALWPDHAKHHGDSTASDGDATFQKEMKKVVDKWNLRPSRLLVIEVYPGRQGEDKGKSEEDQSASTADEMKKRSEIVRDYLKQNGKIADNKILVDVISDACSLARRDVEKERERDKRFDFVFLPYDRSNIAKAKGEHASAECLDGKWKSDLGDVILIVHRDPATKEINVTGEWQESPAKKGVIQSGKYDPAKGSLSVAWHRQWSNHNGSADFQVSFDAKQLKGKWKDDLGESGDWILTRAN